MSENQKKISTPIQDLIADTQKDKTAGPLIGSIIVVMIMIVGALYFVSSMIAEKNKEIETAEKLKQLEEETIIIKTVNQSDSIEVEDIETDLQTTNFDVTDDILLQIEQEF